VAALANEHEVTLEIPERGLPAPFEGAAIRVDLLPVIRSAIGDHALEIGEAFEEHADGVRHADGFELGQDLVVAEGAVHPDLDRLLARTVGSNLVNALTDERARRWSRARCSIDGVPVVAHAIPRLVSHRDP